METLDIQIRTPYGVNAPAEEACAENALSVDRPACPAAVGALSDEDDFDVDVRLIPPSIQGRPVRIKMRFVGREAPRIIFDAERD
jgi:hypothetical protein